MAHLLLLVVASIVSLYAIFLATLWRFQERVVFQPPAALLATDVPARRFAYRSGDDVELFAYVVGDCTTAETTVPAYRGIGVELYSSAVFCFAPEISLAFHRAVSKGDDRLVERFLAEFFHPLVALREQVPGYAVSLVKAAVRQRGLDVGGVRPPLVDPSPEHLEELRRITDAGLALCAEVAA